MKDLKNCSKCGSLSLKSNFHEKLKFRDRLTPHCKLCQNIYRKRYYNEHYDLEINRRRKYRVDKKGKINDSKKRELDLNFKSAGNLRSRTKKALKSQSVG